MALSWITVLGIFALSSIYCILSHPDPETWFQDLFPLKVCPANTSVKTFYGIMFDAGSTGTRIHIYTFIQRSPGFQVFHHKLNIGIVFQDLYAMDCKNPTIIYLDLSHIVGKPLEKTKSTLKHVCEILSHPVEVIRKLNHGN